MKFVYKLLLLIFCLALASCSSQQTLPDFEIVFGGSDSGQCQITPGNAYTFTVETIGNAPTPANVSFSWTTTGAGALPQREGYAVRYESVAEDSSPFIVMVSASTPDGDVVSNSRIDCTIAAVSVSEPNDDSATPVPEPATNTPIPIEAVNEEETLPERILLQTSAEAWDYFSQQEKIVVGVRHDAPPFGFFAEGEGVDAVRGFDVDIAREISRRWFGTPDRVEFVIVTTSNNSNYSERFEALANQEVDFIIAATTATATRCDENMACSQHYFQDGQKLMVRVDSGINEANDLEYKRIVAPKGTTGSEKLASLEDFEQFDIDTDTISSFEANTRKAAIDAVLAGNADAYMTDSKILEALAKDEKDLHVVGGELTAEPYSIGAPVGNNGTVALLDSTLQTMLNDGWYAHIYEQHFGCERPFNMQASGALTLPAEVYQVGSPPVSDCVGSIEETDISQIYVIASGETLGGIARDFYGDFYYYTCIQSASGIEDPKRVAAGTTLTIPSQERCLELLPPDN